MLQGTILLLAAVIIGRRMQGKPDDTMDLPAMTSRAVYDRDLVAQGGGETTEDPVTP